MKTFVLDTNVLINDPFAFRKFGPNHVVIPIVVIAELDGLKKRKDITGTAARQAARELDELRKKGKLHEGVELDGGGILSVHTNVPDIIDFKPNGEQELNDHIILQNCINNPDWTLVTEDTLMRVLGDSLNIKVERYKNSLVKNTQDIYDQIKNIIVPMVDIDELYSVGHTPYYEEDLHENEYVVASCGKQSALARFEFGNLVHVKKKTVMSVKPRNKEQTFLMDALMNPDIKMVAAAGMAGTGKTLLAIAAGLHQTTEVSSPIYNKVTVARPIVPMGKDVGFLPGSLDEKLDPWMGPVYDSIEFLTGGEKNGGVDYYKMDNTLKVEALTYLRGRSLPNQFIICDEAQNMTQHEIKTIVTRAGEGTKIIFTGDPYQIDSPYLDQYNNGLSYLISKFRGQDIFAYVSLHKGERSELAELGAQLL